MRKYVMTATIAVLVIAATALLYLNDIYLGIQTAGLPKSMVNPSPTYELLDIQKELQKGADRIQAQIKEEAERKEIRNVQNILIKLGYNIEVTSKMDEATVNAVKQFQKASGIKETGEVGERTMEQFVMALNPTEYIKPEVVKVASRGGNVNYMVQQAIDLVYEKNAPRGSVLKNKGYLFVKLGYKYNVDPILMASIMATETGWGTSDVIVNYNNPAGIMVKGGKVHKYFSDLEAGMEYSFKNMKTVYFDKGLKTISDIAPVYCPIGASNDLKGTNKDWKPTVSKIYNMIGAVL